MSFTWFSDEKLFIVEPAINLQNDRVYAVAGTRKKQLPHEGPLCTRSTLSKSVMVSVAISSLGCTQLFFIEPGVKINVAYYRDSLLGQHLLPAIRYIAGDVYTFQQDNAPVHQAREIVQFLFKITPDFISPLMWPPNSPDLNPMDYEVWGILQRHSRIQDVDHLKQRLAEEWYQFDQNIIERAVRQWRIRLRVCIRENGCHFEYRL